jgi:hypothetical protein
MARGLARRWLYGPTMKEMQQSEIAEKFLEGLDYPTSKAEILRAAREADVAMPIQESLEKLPDRTYEDSGAVSMALNAAG